MSSLIPPSRSEGARPAALDRRGRRLILPRHLVPVGLLLLERGDIPADNQLAPQLVELEQAGIVRDGRLHPAAHHILAPVATPSAVISVETAAETLPEISTIWRKGSRATLGASRDHTVFELHPVESGLLPFYLAALTRLGVRPDPGLVPISISSDALETALRECSGDVEAAEAALQNGGVPATSARIVARLHAAPAGSWQISTLWTENDGTVRDHSLEVIDGGGLGYWEIDRVATRRRIVHTPRPLAAVLRLLADAVPPG